MTARLTRSVPVSPVFPYRTRQLGGLPAVDCNAAPGCRPVWYRPWCERGQRAAGAGRCCHAKPCHELTLVARPRVARGGSVIVDPGSRVCLQERAGRPPGSPALLVPEDRGDVLGRDAVQVQVDLGRSPRRHGSGRVVARRGIWQCSATRRRAAGPCGTGRGTSPEGNKNGVPGGDYLRRPSPGDDGALAVWQAARMLRAWAQTGASIHCAPLPAGPIQTRQAAMRSNVSPLATLTVLLSTYRRDR